MIYLDHAATTPLHPKLIDLYRTISEQYFANSQSLHSGGSSIKSLLQSAKERWGELLTGNPQDFYFTSGGSESNLLPLETIRVTAKRRQDPRRRIITTKAEHSSLYNYFMSLKEKGYQLTFLPLTKEGVLPLDQLEAHLNDEVLMVAIQGVNSEIGTIQPIKEVGHLIEQLAPRAHFHTDLVQALGKISLNLNDLNIDSAAFSGHKIYGPKGVGALYLNRKSNWRPLFPGTTHQEGLRPGTLDHPNILLFTAALELIESVREEQQRLYQKLRRYFINTIELSPQLQSLITCYGSTDPAKQLPQILGLSLRGVQGQHLMLRGDQQGLAFSTGSACQVGTQSPSRTLTAMGYTHEEADQFIRISLGATNREEDLTELIRLLKEVALEL